MGRDASGRLKSAYSATENSDNVEKNRVARLVACVLCLFLTMLWVCLESAIVVFSSHTLFMTTILSSLQNKGTDQTARMRRVFCNIVCCM